MHIDELCKITSLAKTTILMYLCRVEFSHIKRERRSPEIQNITKKDICRLIELTNRVPNRKRTIPDEYNWINKK